MGTQPRKNIRKFILTATTMLVFAIAGVPAVVCAQEQTAAAAPQGASAPGQLSADEMEVLVARIALYPDDLVALITSASLYPLQIVEASRFLEQAKGNSSLKPKDDWDGSVISLLNYPDIVKMMSNDLDWTQQLGGAVADQQKDLLIAIQTLRDKAVADGIIKSDDKVTVVQQNDNVVIQAANPEKIYVPQYEPRMLYEEGYATAPIRYYPDPYPNYYYPTAPYFAGFVTGAVFGAVVDWDRWGVWGGRFDGNDINIDCDHCFNGMDRNGKVNFNDVDWKNVDRSKIKFDHNQFANMDKTNIRNRVETGGNNDIRTKAKSVRSNAANVDRSRVTPSAIKDVRANKMAGDRTHQGGIGSRSNADSKIGHHAMAGKRDARPSRPSGLGEVRPRSAANLHSKRGGSAMGGGHHASRPQLSGPRGGGAHLRGGRPGGGGGHARVPHRGRHR
ncbi:MAG: DUF3300 domain-containing protein [Mesorhizobium sp.]|uniref:DUF3300 domain-containing protein n=1 Tax=Mesorhizobium sp. TaxID=1871066 RepID=UPI000FE946C4|nr:DUF3300 domain-containing protein [Mesorhizobium sp.]RWF46496.1 MAG: DUF3300 domain-containing protein [Mesorhizobium sp.]TIT68846.1 MAG: DUF3300 domain-containing protein [Mesorhizobium sp.]